MNQVAVAVGMLGGTAEGELATRRVGSLREVAEWSTRRILDTEVVYGLDDAITDLMANSLGALAAALAALRLLTDRGRRSAGRTQAPPRADGDHRRPTVGRPRLTARTVSKLDRRGAGCAAL